MNEIAKYLLDIEAVKIDTDNFFIWASKIKSPIYTDNRLIISFPEIRNKIEKKLAKLIKIKFPEVDFLIGVATSALTHCAYVSSILNLPMGYVRNNKKDHGKKQNIEGNLKNAKNIVIIEDLFSTGNSTLEVVNILKKYNYNVIGVVSIFSYNLNVLKNNFANLKYFSLVTIDELLYTALTMKKITSNNLKIVNDFLFSLNNK